MAARARRPEKGPGERARRKEDSISGVGGARRLPRAREAERGARRDPVPGLFRTSDRSRLPSVRARVVSRRCDRALDFRSGESDLLHFMGLLSVWLEKLDVQNVYALRGC